MANRVYSVKVYDKDKRTWEERDIFSDRKRAMEYAKYHSDAYRQKALVSKEDRLYIYEKGDKRNIFK